jgi:hypothetical protein
VLLLLRALPCRSGTPTLSREASSGERPLATWAAVDDYGIPENAYDRRFVVLHAQSESVPARRVRIVGAAVRGAAAAAKVG